MTDTPYYPRFWLIGRKLAIVLAILISFVSLVTVSVQSINQRADSYDAAIAANQRITQLLAIQMGDGMQYKSNNAVKKIYKKYSADRDANLASLVTYDSAGDVFTTYQSEDFIPYHFSNPLKRHREALDKNQTVTEISKNHILVITPILNELEDIRFGTLAIAWSIESLDKTLNKNTQTLIGLSLLFLVLLVTLMLGVVSKMIHQPLESITASVSSIAEGDLDLEIDTEREDELGILARQFVHMRDQIKDKVARLNEEIEDRKRVDKALHEEEMRFRSIFEYGVGGKAVRGPEGKILLVNQAWCKILGYEQSEIDGITLIDITHPDDLEASQERLQALFEGTADSYRVEKRYIRKSGEVIWVLLGVSSVRDNDGKFLYSISEFQDITEHKKALQDLKNAHDELELRVQERTKNLELQITERKFTEAQLRESEDRLKDIAESASDWFWVLDDELRLTYVSSRFFEITGLNKTEVIGKTRAEFVEPAIFDRDPKNWHQHFDDLKNRRPFVDFEFDMTTPKGDEIYVQISGLPAFNEDGVFIGYRGAGRDITAQKKAEFTLRRKSEIAELLRKSATAANEAVSVEEALQSCLDDVCAFTGWPVGHVLLCTDETPPNLISSGIFHLDDPKKFAKFRKISEKSPLQKGQSAPGEVLAKGRPQWSHIDKVPSRAKGPRMPALVECGLISSIKSPIMVGPKIVGILEFFTEQDLQRDDELLQVIGQIGTLLGRVIERTKARQLRHDAEQRFKDFADSAADRFWETDENHHYTYLSPPQGIMTAPVEKFIGKTPWDKEIRDFTDNGQRKKFIALFKSRKPFHNVPFTWITNGESDLHILLNGVPVYDDTGKFKGYRGTVIDRTSDVEARAKAVGIERWFFEAIENLNTAVIMWNSNTELVMCNHRYKEMQSKNAHVLVPGVKFEDYIRHVALNLENDMTDEELEEWVSFHIKEHFGKTSVERETFRGGRWYLIRKEVMKDGSTIAIHTDITDLKEAEKKLQSSMNELASEIFSRKKAEKDLMDAKIAADGANKAKSEFLSSMSHELRTPLNAILGFGQFLQFDDRNPLNNVQTTHVEQILKGGSHLLELINEILDLAKIEAGKVSLSIEPVSVHTVISECVELTEKLFNTYEIELSETPMEETLPFLSADYIRLKQVLINFLSNAIKYNRKDGKVGIRCQPTGDDMYRISVWDTGPGIPEEKQADLFVPFSRLGQETSEIEGTGIGLTVTRQLIELMNGRIGFDSAVDEGSTFWFELPVAETGDLRKDTPEADVSIDQLLARQKGAAGQLALYVEDNPSNFLLMQRVFTKIPNLVLLHAKSAEEGIKIARKHQIKIILMDINLPGMDGFQAVEVIRKIKSKKDIPVIAVSANAMPRAINKAKKAGFADYLTKPLNIPETIQTILTVMDQKSA